MSGGFRNQLLTRLIVANSVINSKGMFFYSSGPVPAAGKLITSIAVSAAGTDAAGNAYLAGDTTYALIGGTFFAVQQVGRGFTFLTAATEAGPWTNIAAINPLASGQLNIQAGSNLLLSANAGAAQVIVGAAAPSTTAALEVQGGSIQTINLNSIIANGNLQSQLGDILASAGNVNITAAGKGLMRTGETWHVVGAASQPPFLNSFSAGGTAPRFQLEAVGAGRVRLSGAVNTGAVTGANTAMFNLPAGYRPARNLNFVTQNNVTAYTLGSSSVQVTTGGDVQLVPAGTAGKFVVLDGICFELD